MMSYFYLPNEYAGAEMLVIAAVILGGTRMTGGIGTLRGCLLGTLLLTMVANSLILLGISVYWEKVFIGAIINNRYCNFCYAGKKCIEDDRRRRRG